LRDGLINTTLPDPDGTVSFDRPETTFEYDTVGNRTQLQAEVDAGSGYVNDLKNSYTFDNLNRLKRLDQ
jgi:hypothetical protein